MGGVDSAFSMEPAEFKTMVEQIRLTEKAIGIISYDVSEKDLNRRRSLFAVENINKGEIFTYKNVRSIRPGNGLAPKYYNKILGKIAKKDIKKGTPLNWDLVDNMQDL